MTIIIIFSILYLLLEVYLRISDNIFPNGSLARRIQGGGSGGTPKLHKEGKTLRACMQIRHVSVFNSYPNLPPPPPF